MDDVPRLPDEHLQKAKEIIASQRTRSRCNRCYDRGYQGVDQHNMAVICSKCVDGEKVTEQWREYVRATPALVELYGDYFEPDEEEEAAAKEAREKAPPAARDAGRQQRGAAPPQRHRSAGR